jgi:hypothetical protein
LPLKVRPSGIFYDFTRYLYCLTYSEVRVKNYLSLLFG